MNFQDSGIIIAKRQHGESSFILSILTHEHGLFNGLIRQSKSNRPYFEPGVIHKVKWQARLSEHLGSWSIDPIFNPTPTILKSSLILLMLNSACDLIISSVPERENCDQIYTAFTNFLHQTHRPILEILMFYCVLELEIVHLFGHPMQLNRCAVTGSEHNLIYVSPRSGKAVSQNAAQGYESKLLALPSFFVYLNVEHNVSSEHIIDGLNLTGYFLNKTVLELYDKKMPLSRQRLYESIQHMQN